MRKNSESGNFKQPYSEPRMKVVDVNMAPLCSASIEGYSVYGTSYDDDLFN